MHIYTISFFTSLAVFTVLLLVFRYEERRGVRVFERVRTYADFLTLTATHHIHRFFNVFSRDTLRQIFHYFLHILLRVILVLNKEWEKRIRNMIHINRSMAKHAERDRTIRNKLEEVALHKMKTALTEDQKKQHKAKILEG